jgi:hypothetical protein
VGWIHSGWLGDDTPGGLGSAGIGAALRVTYGTLAEDSEGWNR